MATASTLLARCPASGGDWVLVRRDAHGDPWIAAAAGPVTRISRRDGDGHRHTVVTNVDTVFIVMGLDGDFNPRRVERYIALLHGTGAWPVLVLTKRDVAAPSEEMLALRLAELWGRVPPITDVIAVDATSPEEAQSLAPYCAPGQTIVLLGSSGAGKSTLTNALLGHATQDTGRVRSHDSRGKHTTTSRSLHRLPSGACVIDTPGVRTLRPDSDEATVSASFGDIEALAHRCRFRDCTHRNEPGCAVRDAIDADRLRNYHKLLREMRRDTLNPLDRRAALARWKAMARAGAARARAKRGE